MKSSEKTKSEEKIDSFRRPFNQSDGVQMECEGIIPCPYIRSPMISKNFPRGTQRDLVGLCALKSISETSQDGTGSRRIFDSCTGTGIQSIKKVHGCEFAINFLRSRLEEIGLKSNEAEGDLESNETEGSPNDSFYVGLVGSRHKGFEVYTFAFSDNERISKIIYRDTTRAALREKILKDDHFKRNTHYAFCVVDEDELKQSQKHIVESVVYSFSRGLTNLGVNLPENAKLDFVFDGDLEDYHLIGIRRAINSVHPPRFADVSVHFIPKKTIRPNRENRIKMNPSRTVEFFDPNPVYDPEIDPKCYSRQGIMLPILELARDQARRNLITSPSIVAMSNIPIVPFNHYKG